MVEPSREQLLAELRSLEAALKDSEERLSLLFDASSAVGWWDWHILPDRLYAHVQLAEIFGLDGGEAVRGVPLSRYMSCIAPEDRERVTESLTRSAVPGGEFAEEFRVLRPDRTVGWLFARGRCHADDRGRPVRHTGVALDITAEKAADLRKTALLDLGERLREADTVDGIARAAAETLAVPSGATRAGIGTVDLERETLLMQPGWCAPSAAPLEGLYHFRDYGSFIDDLKRGEVVLVADVASDPRTRDHAGALLDLGIRVLLNVPILEHGRLLLVAYVHHDRLYRWTDPELDFVRTVADRTQAATSRVRAEEQRRMLHRELDHRLKNNLAMAQAIVNQTLQSAVDLPTGRVSVEERLGALSRAHRLLMEGSGQTADLLGVVDSALQGLGSARDRVEVSGHGLPLHARAALVLALMLHELGTNSVKYGALSVPEGKVELGWEVARQTGVPSLDLAWREGNGPPVVPPRQEGFGSRLIRYGVASGTGGQVDLDYLPEGLVCRLTAPLSGIQEA